MSHTTHPLSFVPSPQPEGYRYYNIQSDTDRQLLASRCKERLQALHRIPVEERAQYHRALQELLGGLGEESWLVAPFFCDYGSEIEVGSHTFINSGCTILPGVTIGRGSVIGAGSVVTKSIPPMSLAVGNPCRVIRSLSKPTESLD